MTAEHYASLKPGELATLRVIVLPRGRERGDAGDYIQVEIPGGGIVWVPIALLDRAPAAKAA